MSQPPPPPPPGGPYQPQPPGGGYPGPGPHQPWPHQPPPGQWPVAPPPKRGNGWKWALGAVALLAVVGVTVAVTMSVSGGGDSEISPTASLPAGGSASSDVASADDTGPITIVTEDESCAAARPILETRAAAQRNGWIERDASVPSTEWSPEVRAQHEAVGESMRTTAEALIPVAETTPHRVMRQLYEQLISYSRAYADRIAAYTPNDNNLALASIAAAASISNICAAITYGSAAARGRLVELPASSPVELAPVMVGDPQRFLATPDPVCPEWGEAWTRFDTDTSAWLATNPDIPASQWSPEQKALNDDVAPVMRRFASTLQALGDRSYNPTLKDFAELSALYRNAYVKALPTYTPADQYLASASIRVAGLVQAACLAAEE